MLLRIKWQDRIPDTEILSHAEMTSIPTLLMEAQLRWVGHVTRVPATCLPKQIYFRDMKNGKRAQGGPKKCFKDTLKASLKSFNIELSKWERLAQDSPTKRNLIQDGATTSETSRTTNAMVKREQSKTSNNRAVGQENLPKYHVQCAKECSGLRLVSPAICALTVPQTQPNESCPSHHQPMMDDQEVV